MDRHPLPPITSGQLRPHAAPRNGSAGPRDSFRGPARQTAAAAVVPREVVFTFANGWRLARAPRVRWGEQHNCLKELGYRTLYDEAPTEQHTTAWTICRLENANGRFRQQVGFTVAKETSEVGFELSAPLVEHETAAELVNRLFEELGLGPWRATCRHGPSGVVETAFEWGSAGYSPELGAHLCPVCHYPFQIHRAALTPEFSRVFDDAMHHSQAEQILDDNESRKWEV
jgi:hypothetical protein